jgi:spoIIIJ-associated protein
MSGTSAFGQTGSAQEFTGKSVEDATAEGLHRLGLRAEEADIEVVSRGSRGLFGIGSEPAIVRIRPRAAAPVAAPASAQPAPVESAPAQPVDAPALSAPIAQQEAAPEEAPTDEVEPSAAEGATAQERDTQVTGMASEMLETLVHLMGFEGTVAAEWRDADAITDDRHLLLSVHGQNLSALIGRRGDTLENIQYLLRLMVNQKMHRWLNIIVDVEDYRAKRVEHLTHLALRMADQVATTGRSFALEPMPPNERRIIHLALRDHPAVFTESTGDAERRKVNIFPKK